jgi:N-acetylglucosaminyldiphosphoundecaprenol N-acetyl-beta-D-mannosaminyltransferase
MEQPTLSENRSPRRVYLLGAWVDPVDQDQALDEIMSWCRTEARQYVVTPNLDHCRLLRQNPAMAAAYDTAGLVLADGWPLVAASRMTAFPLRKRATGSDLILPLCRTAAQNGFSVFLLGSTDAVLAAVTEKFRTSFPELAIAGVYSPPFGFERDATELAKIDDMITRAKPHIVFVALGAPKQELWMAAHVSSLPIGGALGIGASLDFIAGTQRRAPAIVRHLAMEWAWRALSDPRRLMRRYVACVFVLPGLLLAHLRQHLILKDGTRPRGPANSAQLRAS